MRNPLDSRWALATASNPRCPPALLRGLVRRGEPAVSAAVAANPNTPIELLIDLVARYPEHVLFNPGLELFELESPGSLRELLPEELRVSLLARSPIPGWLRPLFLSSLRVSADWTAVLGAPTCSAEVLLALLARGLEPMLRCGAAQNPAMPAAGVALLEADPVPEVRAALARGTIDHDRIVRLSMDDHPFPRLFARARLGKRPVTRAVRSGIQAHGGSMISPPAANPSFYATRGLPGAYFARTNLSQYPNHSSFVTRALPGAYLALVVDGQEEHRHGKPTSTELVLELIPEAVEGLLPFASEQEEADCVAAAISLAHEKLCLAGRSGWYASMAAVLICENRAHICHVGDAGVLLLRAGSLQALTVDQEPVAEWLAGGPTPSFDGDEDLLKELGKSKDPIVPARITQLIEPGDLFVLRTRGISQIHEEQMARILGAHAGDTAGAAASLATAADNSDTYEHSSVVVLDPAIRKALP